MIQIRYYKVNKQKEDNYHLINNKYNENMINRC